MRNQHIVALLWVATLAVCSVSCLGESFTLGYCEVVDDCHTWLNYAGGTVCVQGRCVCPSPDETPCCPDGRATCAWEEYACRPRSICLAGSILEEGAVASSSSGGPIVHVAPGGPCTTDEECPWPVDHRCGTKQCKLGKCTYDFGEGDAIPNQKPGDCRINLCDLYGNVNKEYEGLDLPFDGQLCTWDVCSPDEAPSNPHLTDGLPCPGDETWVCSYGKCQECSQALGKTTCPGGKFCDWDRCTPLSCNDMAYNNGETDVDCGGPNCRPCADGQGCFLGIDCASGVCTSNVCQKGTHMDKVKNNSEVGIDCGYLNGPLYDCPDGQACLSLTDCMSHVCYGGICQTPTCTDDVLNRDEIKTDCGGFYCPPCL